MPIMKMVRRIRRWTSPVSMTLAGETWRTYIPIAISLASILPFSLAGTGLWASISAYLTTFAAVYLGLTWAAMTRANPERLTRWAGEVSAARARPLSRRLLSSFSFGEGGLASIVGVSLTALILALSLLIAARQGSELGRAQGSEEGGVLLVLSALAIIIYWAMLHSSYALYYAYLYYRSSGDRPVEFSFPGSEEPDALDFAYFAFAVGTSLAVSDVKATSRGARRVVLGHQVLAFFYNTAVLALVFNLVLGGF